MDSIREGRMPGGRSLTELERQLLDPELREIQAGQAAMQRLHRMLALVEPRMTDPKSGLSFDMQTLSFVQGEPCKDCPPAEGDAHAG